MKIPLFTGLCTALITPFSDAGIDFVMLDRLIERQLACRVSALVVCGTTGEAATLSIEEKMNLIQHTVRQVAGRCKVLAGTGTNSTADAVRMSGLAQSYGADGLLVVTPYYNKTSQAGLIRHYETIAQAVNLPIIVYHVPARTGLSITCDTYAELSKIPNINGVKEASGDLPLVSRTMQRCGDDLYFWSGNDDTTAAMMAVGAKGLISTTANLIPDAFVAMCNACLSGNFEKGAAIQNRLMPLIDAMFADINPMPVKAAMELAGFSVGTCRPPLWKLSEEHQRLISNLIEDYSIA